MILIWHLSGLSVSAIARQAGASTENRQDLHRQRAGQPLDLQEARAGARRRRSLRSRERLVAYPALPPRGVYSARSRSAVFRRLQRRAGPRARYPARRIRSALSRRRRASRRKIDFARFEVEFLDEPGIKRIVWLFSMVLGYSRLTARLSSSTRICSVLLPSPLWRRSADAAHVILTHRMKTVVIGEDADGAVVYNRALVDLQARHYGFQPRACRPYRAKTKGKVERPFRYIREDFFLGGAFRNLEDLNDQIRHWLDTVANPRVHATTQRVVNEAFAEEKVSLEPLPRSPYRSVLRLEASFAEGMVSVGGNFYSVLDTSAGVFDVHVLADEP